MFEKKKEMLLLVEGMHCEACANRVKKALETKKEIKKVKVDLKTKQVLLSYIGSLEQQEIRNIVEDLGYQVIEMREG